MVPRIETHFNLHGDVFIKHISKPRALLIQGPMLVLQVSRCSNDPPKDFYPPCPLLLHEHCLNLGGLKSTLQLHASIQSTKLPSMAQSSPLKCLTLLWCKASSKQATHLHVVFMKNATKLYEDP